MPDAPPRIRELVETFARSIETYRSGQYNEAQVRREFIDPFFIELGWDVHNEQGYAHAYKHVIHEDTLKVGAATKAPDYSFRIGGVRKFFLEAKKPSVDIKGDPHPAYQLRRYAWSAKLPLSILTDFEEFAVYDCRTRPRPTDRASASRIMFIRYDEYPKRWREIAAIFSREAVLKGSFDKFAQSRRQKGTAEVDVAFLADIENWRDMLARNVALRNPHLTGRQLNFAVQITIDRIIFLRMCEDRGIESYAGLQSILPGDRIYQRLCERFENADKLYNSGLFHFEAEKGRTTPPDELTLALNIDDKDLKYILQSLYYPQCPYEFSVLPPEILGNVYEQFLGKVITLTSGHRARIEEKPEVKKAGGVYYTPSYIVDYIVQNTVGKLIEGKDPRQVAELRILDPACGSGSFLLGAYTRLLDYHRDWYTGHDPESWARKSKPPIRQIDTPLGPAWVLTVAEKKRILVNNIFGVDIDSQAVEVTKLSLLLKVLEGETAETLGSTRKLFHERALPDLGDNIKCGNSLIAPDFFDTIDPKTITEDLREKVNAFDWETEFPTIFKRKPPGFDAVIGNPPWGQKAITDDPVVKHYIHDRYPSTAGIYDLFRPFVEHGVNVLREDGSFGMVLPDIILLKDYPETRRFLLGRLRLDAIDWWGMAFSNAVIDAATIMGARSACPPHHKVRVAIHDEHHPLSHDIPQTDFAANPRFVFNLHLTPQKRRIVKRMGQFPRLSDYFELHEGVHSGNIREELFVARRVDATCEELLFGRDEISPHRLSWKGRFIRLGAMPARKTARRYANVGQQQWHRHPKLLVRRTGDYVLAAVDAKGRFASNNFFLVFPHRPCPLDLYGLCALLNSRFMTWYFRTIEPRRGRVFAELKIKHLQTFPLPPMTDNAEVCDELNRLGRERAELTQSMDKRRTPHEKTRIERECNVLDRRIEQIVHDVFNLSEAIESQFAPTSTQERVP